MIANTWHLGADGKHHLTNCWLLAPCGHTTFFGLTKRAEDLSTAEMCPVCLNEFFFQTIHIRQEGSVCQN
jgi:hypothetical protein